MNICIIIVSKHKKTNMLIKFRKWFKRIDLSINPFMSFIPIVIRQVLFNYLRSDSILHLAHSRFRWPEIENPIDNRVDAGICAGEKEQRLLDPMIHFTERLRVHKEPRKIGNNFNIDWWWFLRLFRFKLQAKKCWRGPVFGKKITPQLLISVITFTMSG